MYAAARTARFKKKVNPISIEDLRETSNRSGDVARQNAEINPALQLKRLRVKPYVASTSAVDKMANGKRAENSDKPNILYEAAMNQKFIIGLEK